MHIVTITPAICWLMFIATGWFADYADGQPFMLEPTEFEPNLSEAAQRLEENYTGFVFGFNNARASDVTPNGNIKPNQVTSNPFLSTLPGDGNAQTLVTMGPCAGNTPHTHPRGSEISFLLYGAIEFGMVEENGAHNNLVLRNMAQNQSIHVPQGLLHFSFNPNCEPAAFLANFATSDPGTQSMWNSMMHIPNRILNQASGIPEATFQNLKSNYMLVTAPGTGGEACMRKCGLSFNASLCMGCVHSQEGKELVLSDKQVNDRYEHIRHLDSGTYGRVYLVKDKQTSTEVAIKYIARGEINKYVRAEIINLSICRHPQVIQFEDVFLTASDIAIVMEYASGGNLHTYIVNKSSERGGQGILEKEAKWIFQQLVIGVDYCHKVGVVNRDLKLENTLLVTADRKPLVKICDFGVSKRQNISSVMITRVGTPGYTAPEVLKGDISYDGAKADVWSLGVILFLMVFGRHPFYDERDHDDEDFTATTKRIRAGKYEYPSYLVSSGLRSLLERIFVVDPARRISVAGLFDQPWVKKGLPRKALEVNENWQRSAEVQEQVEQTKLKLTRILDVASLS